MREQKQTNESLRQIAKEAFVQMVTEGRAAAPYYFPINSKLIKKDTKPWIQF